MRRIDSHEATRREPKGAVSMAELTNDQTAVTLGALERFTYTLVRPGQARVGMHPGSRQGFLGPHFDVTARSDAQGDLARAVITLLRGADRAQVTWYGNPGRGETLQLIRTAERLRIAITFFNPPYRHQTTGPSAHPPQVFELTLYQFARQVHHLLTVLLRQWGPEGYRAMWPPYEFPIQEHHTLGEFIAARSGQASEQ
jgi:hypothetical protein